MLFSLGIFSELTFAFPDILSALSLVLLIVLKSVLGGKYSKITFPKISLILSMLSLIATVVYSSFDKKFDTGLFVYNYSLANMKIILLSILSLGILFLNYTRRYKTLSANFFIFIYGIVNAIMLCLSANNFLVLILGLELYTFSLTFILLNDDYSIESRKCTIRFILSSTVMSAVFLFGCSILYSQFGSLSFTKVNLTKDFSSMIGSGLILCYLLFKMGCAPFHNWMIDVYEKASTLIILFLDAIWKFFMAFIFIRIFSVFLPGESSRYQLILIAISIMSMIFGSIIPIFQRNIHKFIASASIGHIGFLMTIFATTNVIQSSAEVLSYLSYYAISSICFFSGIMIVRGYRPIKEFSDLTGIINTSPIIGFLILLSMFSMIGLPPFGNFIAKLNIFQLLIQSKNYILLSTSVFYSVTSMFYVIKWSRFFFRPIKHDPIYISNAILIPCFELLILLFSVFLYNHIEITFVNIVNGSA